jgi:hypothetical protein
MNRSHLRILVLWAVLSTLSSAYASETSFEYSKDGDLGLPAISWGFKAGLSLSTNTGILERDSEFEVSSEYRKGFAGGLFLYMPVTERFAMQQEVLYVQKGSRPDITIEILDVPTVLHVTYDMDYIEIPVMCMYTWYRKSGREFYTYAGAALSFKVHDRYQLEGEIDDGVEQVPLYVDSDMSEVEMFDYAFVFGGGLDFRIFRVDLLLEYRFTISWNELAMPTYAYVPFEDDEILIENDPVPLKNQAHYILLGLTF